MSYRRSLTFNEQLFFVNSVFKHRDAVQVLVKLTSSNHNKAVDSLKRGIELVSRAHRIHSRRVRGSKLYLDNTNDVYVKIHHEDKEPSLKSPLFNDPVKNTGTLIEHHIIVTTKHLFLLVKCHHVLMDGSAYVQYLKDLFKAIRGVPIIGDQHLYSEADAFPADISKSAGLQRPKISRVRGDWRPKRPPETLSHDKVIGNLCAVLALAVSKATGRKGSFIVPFDLRKFGICNSGFGNMTLPIYLFVKPTDSISEITAQLNFQVKYKAPLNNSLSSFWIKRIPNWLLGPSVKFIHMFSRITGYYFASGFISDLGQVSLQHFSAPGLDAVDLIPVPMVGTQSPYSAFCLSHENGTRIGLAVHVGEGLQKWEEEIRSIIDKPNPVLNEVDVAENESLVEVIISAWTRFLKLEKQEDITLSNNSFSDFGGDSVALVLMCSEIQKELSLEGNQQVMTNIFARGTSITLHEMIKIYTR